jgi:glycosyltransferase involved in cell wall biosynthesis
VNVHPDYVCFPDIEVESSGRTYPIAFYRQMLSHVRDNYGGEVWTPTAGELAQWFVQARGKSSVARPFLPPPGRRAETPLVINGGPETPSRFTLEAGAPKVSDMADGLPETLPPRKLVAMVCYSDYDTDNRVMRYAEALAKRGDSVHIFCLRRNAKQSRFETANGVHVHRIQDRFQKSEQTKVSYLLPTLVFCLRCAFLLPRQRYDVIHVHNMPDFLVFAALGSKMAGAKVILDIHDIVPELSASKFKLDAKARTVQYLKWIERWSARFADRVIISNHLWFDKFVLRTGCASKCSVFINNVNSDIFFERGRRPEDGKFILMFPGGLQWHQGLDIAIRAFHKVAPEVPNAEFHIYGDGNMKESLIALTKDLKLSDKVRFFDPLPVRQIADVMSKADLGVVPKRADSFGNEAYSTKIMEFMSLGVPALVSKTKIDQFYFTPDVVRFFESGNSDALAEGMLELIRKPEQRTEMSARAFDYANRHSWSLRRQDYLDLVDGVCGHEPGKGPLRRMEEMISHAL